MESREKNTKVPDCSNETGKDRKRGRRSGHKRRQGIKAIELKVGTEEEESCFENKYVHEVYDMIAPHFAHTRYKPWPGVKSFLSSRTPGSTVLEVGCGNGRNLWANKDVFVVGCDLSSPLLTFAAASGKELGRSAGFIQCDCLKLPFKESSFDACMMIAVLHHLATEERRLNALKEIYNILAPGGLLMVTVWGFEDNKEEFGLVSQDSAIRWQTEPQHMITKKGPKEQKSETTSTLPSVEVYTRYYHFFVKGELSGLCRKAGFEILTKEEASPLTVQGEWIEESTECKDHGNWVVVARKK